MRKIRLHTTVNADTFAPISMIVIKNEDGTKTVFKKEREFEPRMLKYTDEQIATIKSINLLLKENNQAEMTPEEMDWAADPGAYIKRTNEMTEEELQALAGFKVEKIIKKFPMESV